MKDFLNLTFHGITSLAALIAVTITILLNWKALKKFLNSYHFSKSKRKIANVKTISRRKFIIIGASITSFIFWGLIHYRLAKKELNKIGDTFFNGNRNLTINKTTGIIHHRKLCSDHLPIGKNVTDFNNSTSNIKFHKSKKVPILDLLTQNRNAEDAIEILLLAADGNSTSVHIYDKLIKLLGKIKRYESIHLLLRDAEDDLNQALLEKKSGSKEYKKYQKALRHIQMQKEKVLSNARIRAFGN